MNVATNKISRVLCQFIEELNSSTLHTRKSGVAWFDKTMQHTILHLLLNTFNINTSGGVTDQSENVNEEEGAGNHENVMISKNSKRKSQALG